MAEPIRVLALHAHPDDLEIQVAGTLALLRREGHHVVMATMTPGDCGSAELDADSIAAVRREEARKAAEMIGADYLCLEFRDLAIFNDDRSRRKVTEVLRRVRPDLVITAPPVDYLCDHEMTSILVRDACFCAPIQNYLTKEWDPSPPLTKIPLLYYSDAIGGVDRDDEPIVAGFHINVTEVFELKDALRQPAEPHFYTDIGQVLARKRAMLACHASQRDWLFRQHGIDEYLETQREWSSKRGIEIGVAHAEAFRQYLGHAYPRHNLLLELLGQDGKGGKLG